MPQNTNDNQAERMRKAILQHNSFAAQGGEAGVIRREEMKKNALRERVFLTAAVPQNWEAVNDSSPIPLDSFLSTISDDKECAPKNISITQNDVLFTNSLPRADRSLNQFLLEVFCPPFRAVFCAKELPWHVAVAIESDSFRTDEIGAYFSEEAERRETLREAVIWVADFDSQVILHNEDSGFLNRISDEALCALWLAYEEEVTFYAEDAKQLYDTALGYFSGESDGLGLHPLIHEVDMAFKFGGFSRSDIRGFTKPEYDRLKVIERARHDAIRAPQTASEALDSGFIEVSAPHPVASLLEGHTLPPDFFPDAQGDHIRSGENFLPTLISVKSRILC